MTRNDSERENLMDEAVSLVERLEFQCPSSTTPSLIGVNQLDWLFVYLDQDTMYRFDDQGRLRRAFISDTLYRTTGQTLAALVRWRSDPESPAPARSQLLRRDLSLDELAAFREQMRRDLSELSRGLTTGTMLRQFPAEMRDFPGRMQQRLRQILDAAEFLAPAIVRRSD